MQHLQTQYDYYRKNSGDRPDDKRLRVEFVASKVLGLQGTNSRALWILGIKALVVLKVIAENDVFEYLDSSVEDFMNFNIYVNLLSKYVTKSGHCYYEFTGASVDGFIFTKENVEELLRWTK